jgi:hypothetical protein
MAAEQPLVADRSALDLAHFPGRPLPSGLLSAVGTRRGGPWVIGLAVGVMTTVLVYSAGMALKWPVQQPLSVMAGTIVAFLVGWLLAGLAGHINAARLAYPDQDRELLDRSRLASARLGCITPVDPSTAPLRSMVEWLLADLSADLAARGPQWLDASGYLNAWARLHEAEEDLILVDTEDEVIAAGLADLLRLNDSEIPARMILAQEINDSLPFIAGGGVQLHPPVAAASPLSPSVARRRIRKVRMAINRDRDDKWDQIVRSRNGLVIAAAVALLVSYLLVVLAIGFEVPPRVLASALVFVLVGALVSSVHQLFVRSGAQNEVEDFGYSNVKLLVVPILSGLVAVLAIVVLTQTQISVSGQTLGGTFSSWQAAFDWRKNPAAIWIAILFGFAPSLLFSLLQTRVDSALSSLKSSSSGGGTTK